MNTVIGPDISFYQDEPQTPEGVDFNVLKAASDFVIVRAGQNLWVDPKFKLHWAESKRVGIPRGCYWFYDSRVHPKKQAEMWVNALDGDLGELPLFGDFEESYGGNFKGWKHWYDFLEQLKRLVGTKEIGIYTAMDYWTNNGPDPVIEKSKLEYFHQYPLWIANYGTQKPKVPEPWAADEWLFWQFTEIGNGKAYGVETQGIDLNYFNGDIEAFQKRFTNSSVVLPTPPKAPTDAHNPVPESPINMPDPIPEIPSPTPEPMAIDPDNTLYRVVTKALNMRGGPSTANDIVSQLTLDTIIQGIGITRDKKWIQVQTSQGQIGWCYNTYIQAVDDIQSPNPLKVTLFNGVLFIREFLTKPRKMVANILFIDLNDDDVDFLITPPGIPKEDYFCARTTTQFLTEFKCQIAINGDVFSNSSSKNSCPNGSVLVKPNGFAASKGLIYNATEKDQPTLFISRNNQFAFNIPQKEIYNAISGTHILLKKGKIEESLSQDQSIESRTALGVSANGRWLTLIVLDGSQPGYSEGIMLNELANLLLKYGAYDAINLDGGSSSTMVMEGLNGVSHTLNTPCEKMLGKERTVANHFGIQLKNGR